MQPARNLRILIVLCVCAAVVANAFAFEGKIDIVTSQGNETTALLYTVGTNSLRIEVNGSDSDKSRAGPPNPIDIVDLKSGALTILFAHNRSFVRLKSPSANSTATPGAPAMPPPPPGVGPQSNPNPAVAGTPGAGMPPMPAMPPMMGEKIELKPTGKKEKILGFACEQYEIKQRGETMEIWATDKLLPFQPYARNQSPRFGPRMIEEQWPELLQSRRLFPLRATLRYAMPSSRSTEKREKDVAATSTERFRFEVKSITPEKVEDKDGKLFQPPEGYIETQPLPF